MWRGALNLAPATQDYILTMPYTASDIAFRTKHATHVQSAALATQDDDGGLQSAPATKNVAHLLKTKQKYCAPHTKAIFDAFMTMS